MSVSVYFDGFIINMEEILVTIFSEKWIIYWLFVFTFVMTIYKWIPYIVKKFDDVIQKFADMIREQNVFFKEELQKISETFISKVISSDEWHKQHHERLNRVEEGIQEIKKSVWKTQ